jgi:hypothetical protein
MAKGGYKIFISSTMKDLAIQRKKIADIISDTGNVPVLAEKIIEVRKSPRKVLEKKVKECHAYIGIFHKKWGYIPKNDNPEKLSITAMEYNFAKQKGIPRLILVSRSQKAKKLKRFVNQLSDMDSGNWYSKYGNFRELSIVISQGIYYLIEDISVAKTKQFDRQKWRKIYENHLADLKNCIVRPIIAYLDKNSFDIKRIMQIVNQDLFNDYLKHFNLESQWETIKNNQNEVLSLKNVIESEFRNFCNQKDIPVIQEIKKVSYYGLDTYPATINELPTKDFIERLIKMVKNPSFESILDNRLKIRKYPSQTIIYFLKDENSPGNISIMYQGGDETENIFNHLRQYITDSRNSININKLNNIEQIVERDINKFKASIEKTLYVCILPTNIHCPFLATS